MKKKNAGPIIPLSDIPARLRDAPDIRCPKCGRRSSAAWIGMRCAMPQPDGSVCQGVMRKEGGAA